MKKNRLARILYIGLFSFLATSYFNIQAMKRKIVEAQEEEVTQSNKLRKIDNSTPESFDSSGISKKPEEKTRFVLCLLSDENFLNNETLLNNLPDETIKKTLKYVIEKSRIESLKTLLDNLKKRLKNFAYELLIYTVETNTFNSTAQILEAFSFSKKQLLNASKKTKCKMIQNLLLDQIGLGKEDLDEPDLVTE